MKNIKLFGFLTIFLGLLGCYLILSNLLEPERTILSYVSVIGTFASIVGLILAYMQIISLKESTIQTNAEVKRTVQRVNNILSVSGLSKTRKQIEEIQAYLQSRNFQGALIRMRDLKDELVSAKYIKGLETIYDTKDYKNILMNTGIDIDLLNDHLINQSDKIDVYLITKNLEITKELLVNCDNKIRTQSYEVN